MTMSLNIARAWFLFALQPDLNCKQNQKWQVLTFSLKFLWRHNEKLKPTQFSSFRNLKHNHTVLGKQSQNSENRKSVL